MELFDIISYISCKGKGQKSMIVNNIKRIKTYFYNFCTGFPLKMWKSQRTSFLSQTCVVLLCLFLLISCSSLKKMVGKEPGKEPTKSQSKIPLLENSLISMSEEEIRKKLGEPTIVSLTTEDRILWTYVPEWKLIPDNKDTVYVEFEKGKVVKVIKAKK
jgi:outer membrane protein assembly factor BamE (lipoprotein component of BamABCDE complex)